MPNPSRKNAIGKGFYRGAVRHYRMPIGKIEGGEMVEHSLGQRMLAEMIGTALLVLVGPGSVVATLILAGDSKPAITGADLLGISVAFGLIIAALVYAIGKVSGCHINPAVTCALALTKRFPVREVPAYVAAQVVGAVIGAFAIWAVFAHTAIDLGMGQTSFNEDASTWAQAIFSEGIGTFMLMFAILGIVDSRSPSDLAGLVIGGVVVAIIMIVGPITGASLNPARAFGPELISAIGGGVTHWAQLIPVYVLPGLVGAGLAAVVYDVLATPRKVERPIREAVTTPDTVPAPSAAATR
jgi:glycerol uptake facilitator